MGRFIPWFTLAIEHSYFVDSLWRGVAFIPAPSTEKMAKNAGLIFKEVDGGIAALADEERTSALSLYAQEGGGSVHFWFKAHVRNRSFASFTALPAPKQGSVLFFENQQDSREEGKRVLLSRDANVSAADLVKIDALIGEEGLGAEVRRVPPDFVVHLAIAPPVTSAEGPRDFGVRFEARQAFLKYYLLGNLNRSNAFIVDLDNKIEFESCGDQELPGRRMAKVFRSKERISVRERTSYRFQLREQGQSGGKVLIKRLPVAAEGRLGSEVVDGKAEPIFEAYVNC